MFGLTIARGVIAGLVLLLPSALQGQHQQAQQQAVEEATAWVNLVDEGSYGESWEQAAALFREAVTRDQWIGALNDARGPLGAVISRSVRTADYSTNVPGAPPGEYVVIQYETSFAQMASAIEIITPMLERDGSWRVSGYFIRPANSP
jgi:hypothetical protein